MTDISDAVPARNGNSKKKKEKVSNGHRSSHMPQQHLVTDVYCYLTLGIIFYTNNSKYSHFATKLIKDFILLSYECIDKFILHNTFLYCFHETQVIKKKQINARRYLRPTNLLAKFLLLVIAVNLNYTVVVNEAYNITKFKSVHCRRQTFNILPKWTFFSYQLVL